MACCRFLEGYFEGYGFLQALQNGSVLFYLSGRHVSQEKYELLQFQHGKSVYIEEEPKYQWVCLQCKKCGQVRWSQYILGLFQLKTWVCLVKNPCCSWFPAAIRQFTVTRNSRGSNTSGIRGHLYLYVHRQHIYLQEKKTQQSEGVNLEFKHLSQHGRARLTPTPRSTCDNQLKFMSCFWLGLRTMHSGNPGKS